MAASLYMAAWGFPKFLLFQPACSHPLLMGSGDFFMAASPSLNILFPFFWMHVDMGSMARLEILKDAAECCFGKCPNPSNRLISRLLEWPGWTGFSRTSPEIYDLGLCVFPRSNACRNSFAMERCQQFKVAAPQRSSLLLCKDDSWFYWFSHRECVPMAEWSIRTWRWRDIVYGVSVLQFWRCDARMMALLLHLPLQKFWFSSLEKFWSLSYKKK